MPVAHPLELCTPLLVKMLVGHEDRKALQYSVFTNLPSRYFLQFLH